MIMIVILAFWCSILGVEGLSGSVVASYCHCDLTASFCDIGCCCDGDCSAAISTDCYNLKSLSYCPDNTFFSRIKSGYINSQGCFYYNKTNTVIDEVTPGTRQVLKIINKQYNLNRENKSGNSPKWVGYLQGDPIQIGSTPSFSVIDSTGACLTSGNSSGMPFTFRFGVNMNIYCKCPGCTTLPSIFSSFSAKTINQFKDDTTKKISIPSIAAGATNLILKFIVGSYGTQRSKYIERVTVEVKSSSSSDLDRKLNIVFVQSSQIAIQDSNPSFFPQIPKDMFYPIFFMS